MIYIIGAGAIGKALAVFLKNAGKEVILVRGSVDRQQEVTETIRVKMPDESELKADILTTTFSELGQLNGLVVVTTKSNGNADIANKLAGTTAPIILLQNGLNIEAPFFAGGFTQLFRCVLMVTSQFIQEDLIQFKPVAACPVGDLSENGAQLPGIVSQLDNPWFRFKTETNIQPIIWKKAIVNCVFNSVCPLLETDNGIFHRDHAALVIARRVITECLAVARQSGILLTIEDVEQTLLSISHSADGQFISTLQDIRNKRPTEIGTLNHEIVKMAELHQMGHMVTETRLLGELTLIKSKLNR